MNASELEPLQTFRVDGKHGDEGRPRYVIRQDLWDMENPPKTRKSDPPADAVFYMFMVSLKSGGIPGETEVSKYGH